MTDAHHARLAEEFDRSRNHLRAVAYRMLGSADETEDAVQEGWLRASGADADAVTNLKGWLTVIVGRIYLDMLRSRRHRREDFVEAAELDRMTADAADPQDEAELADSVGLALLVVLDTLSPAERVAFVLHDLFAVPFDEIAPIVERSAVAAKKLASRARRRVHGKAVVAERDLVRQRTVVEAFLAASRAGDIDGLLAVLAPDVVRRAEPVVLRVGLETELRGARQPRRRDAGQHPPGPLRASGPGQRSGRRGGGAPRPAGAGSSVHDRRRPHRRNERDQQFRQIASAATGRPRRPVVLGTLLSTA